MATPHDDDAPPASPDITTATTRRQMWGDFVREMMTDPPETVTETDLDEVSIHDAVRLARPEEREGAIAVAALQRLGLTLLPRLARAYRRACEERDTGVLTDDIIAPAVAKAERDAYARGRREAIEEYRHVLTLAVEELSAVLRGDREPGPRAIGAVVATRDALRRALEGAVLK